MARLPNVPTVWSNVFTAWVLASNLRDPMSETVMDAAMPTFPRHWVSFVLALFGGTMMYMGGTVLCDAQDVEFDRQYRPERPIPAGRVSVKAATWVSLALLVAGNLAMVGASLRIVVIQLPKYKDSLVFMEGHAEGVIRLMLALYLCIVTYALIHKRSGVIGAILMGFCRALLGLTAVLTANGKIWEAVPWIMALGLYTLGISLLARGESRGVRGGILPDLVLLALVPPAVVFLNRSLWDNESGSWIGYILWVAAVWWFTKPLWSGAGRPARGPAVGRTLGMMPILDAMFVMPAWGVEWGLVPIACAGMAWALRRVAAAT